MEEKAMIFNMCHPGKDLSSFNTHHVLWPRLDALGCYTWASQLSPSRSLGPFQLALPAGPSAHLQGEAPQKVNVIGKAPLTVFSFPPFFPIFCLGKYTFCKHV